MYSFPPALPDMVTSTYLPRPPSPPPLFQNQTANQAAHQTHLSQRQQRADRDEAKRRQALSPLTQLAADEAAIAARKTAIRNFGSHWIRPPGVAKTLQAMNEEEAERLEQEELQRQERGMADLEARQQVEELRLRNAEGGDEGDGEEERDLDEEVPDAEEDDEESEAAEGSAIEITQGSVSFNEESMVGGSRVEGGMLDEDEEARYAQELEEAELTGAARDEEDLGIERDLDDSVPEAGSYEHTDTELEDDDSGLQDSFAGMGVRSTRRSGLRNSSLSSRSARSARLARAMGSLTSAGSLDADMMGPPRSNTGTRIFDDNRMGETSLQGRMRAQAGVGEALPRSPGSLNLDSSLLGSSFMGSSPVMTRGGASMRARGAAGRGRGGVGRPQQQRQNFDDTLSEQENPRSSRHFAQQLANDLTIQLHARRAGLDPPASDFGISWFR